MKLRMMIFALVLALMATAAPAALAEGNFPAVVAAKSMKVYAESVPHEYLGALPRGTEVTVVDYSGQAALILWNGMRGIAKVSDLAAVAAQAQQSAQEADRETATSAELSGAKPMVTAKSARVYQKASTSSRSIKLKAGVSVNVLAVSGKWARVERSGAVGYMKKSNLREPAAESSVIRYGDDPVMPTEDVRVYSEPSTASSYVKVAKGTKLLLQAVRGNCAQVKRNGATGYVAADKLTDYVEPAAAPDTAEIVPGQSSAPADAIFAGSNEQIIFKFLTKEAGYNAAAACGVLANIKYESGFKPTSGGDGGTSYGICQWHLGRKTRLINWCSANGYDYSTLEGQLYFLKHELKTYYPAVHNYLKSTANTAQGAYDAGYYFCYNFEAPASRATRSVTRGNYARDTLWGRYTT